MIQSIVSVRDSAAGAFGRPLFVPTNAVAVRSMRDEVNRAAADNDMYKYASDYELYQIGSFDDSTGAITPCDPVMITRAKDLKESV